jgi:hypothetical protein
VSAGGDTSGLVPYTGASSDVDLGGQVLTADNLISTTSGFQAYNSGGFNFFSDSGDTSVGSLYALDLGQYIMSHTDGEATFDFTNLTDNQSYEFPDTSGTVALTSDIAGKQDTLVSGTNIKTINGSSILGSGDLTVVGGSGVSEELALAYAVAL